MARKPTKEKLVEILSTHPISNLKKAIARTNQTYKGYTKMNKKELITLMTRTTADMDNFITIKEHATKRQKAKRELEEKAAAEAKEAKSKAKKAKAEAKKPEAKKPEAKKPPRKRTVLSSSGRFVTREETHEMPDGTVMTGKKHTAKSKPVDKKPKAKKVEPKINFKNELYNRLNKYYELLNKIELKVLNKKIKDDSKEYYNQQADVEDIINEKLSRLLKKYKINLHGLDDTTEFFSRSRSPISKPLDNLNMDKLNFKQIPNYKKLQNTGDKIEKSK
jgi:hypothetical protein